jgi:hypothetical protein
MKRVVLIAFLAIFATNNYSYGQILEPRKGANDKWGFVDETNKLIIPFKYDLVDGFSEGLAAVVFNGKWGFIDRNDNVVIPFKYDLAFHFVENLTAAELNGKTGFIDRTGKTVIPFKYDFAVNFSESRFNGFSMVRLDGKYGFIDKTGTEIVPVKYTSDKAEQKLLKNTRKSVAKL